MTATVDERVAKGAQFLDERDPGWWREDVPNAIDLDTLEMLSLSLCVLGQRCPLEVLQAYEACGAHNAFGADYDRYWAFAIALTGKDIGEIHGWALEHGFTYRSAGADDHGWTDLTTAWWVLINDRRKRAADAGDVR